jgi:twitching motility two-component system response regulator PilG
VAKAIYPCIQQGWVQMPSSVPVDLQQQRREGQLPGGVRPRVVCIDDDGAIGKMIEYTLLAHGYQVTIIQDPLESFAQIFQLQPDLILCDLVMPKLDGYDLCGMLRQSTAFRQTPILMLTGKDGFIDRVRAKMVGATDYLTKPFQEQELLMLLEKYIGLGEPNI